MINNGNKPYATTGNLQEHKHDLFGNKLKSVMFSARVHVILIPSITEYESAGLAQYLWWEDDDYKDFKQSALKEVKDYMIEKSISDSKEAIKLLYQNMDSDDLENIVAAEDRRKAVENNSSETSAKNQIEPNSDKSIEQLLLETKSQNDENRNEECTSNIFGFRRLSNAIKSHSFCAASTPQTFQLGRDMDISSFRSKTDVDIIHDKSTELSSQEFLQKLRKLHYDKLSRINKDHSQDQIHPLALICS